ncbi:uncharacterized protein HD556DRAFT_1230306 [Suillus plorans]|uniref:Uncharacterized protein n=1 Tax=Suillus plorans TaxID=116603 RepID=A0A9P7DPW6_9AGAM|nr:uncharacterized protein HD556DRAFT_1230306 [Suillus plorans]KAG1800236.1 hypothetical protein HD556DRAFT_1230306 [Suillus plorans]
MRHASPFHQHQTIEEHFSFWDADKYATLEALKSIQTLTAELVTIKAELSLTDEDFYQFYKEEYDHLDSLKLPPVRDQLCIHYVEVLDELAELRTDWDAAREVGNNALTSIPTGSLEQINSALTQAHIQVDTSYTKLQNAEALVAHIEVQLVVDQRWEIGGPEYQHFKEEATLGKYCTALDELERLIVMRLFKLSKLSLLGTGKFIGKALQRCSDVIRDAINWYNTQAVALKPPLSPQPKISWKDIADYGFLGKFDLLRYSRNNIRTSDWSKPGHRETTTKFFKLC